MALAAWRWRSDQRKAKSMSSQAIAKSNALHQNKLAKACSGISACGGSSKRVAAKTAQSEESGEINKMA